MNGTVDTTFVPAQAALDSITVYWHNYNPGQGMVTIVCFGASWTAYFNAMSSQAIQQFFRECGADYLTNALSRSPHLTQRKRDADYLMRVVKAIKAHLATEVPA